MRLLVCWYLSQASGGGLGGACPELFPLEVRNDFHCVDKADSADFRAASVKAG